MVELWGRGGVEGRGGEGRRRGEGMREEGREEEGKKERKERKGELCFYPCNYTAGEERQGRGEWREEGGQEEQWISYLSSILPHWEHLKQSLCHLWPSANTSSAMYTVLQHLGHLAPPPHLDILEGETVHEGNWEDSDKIHAVSRVLIVHIQFQRLQ